MYKKEPMVGIIKDLSIEAFVNDNLERHIYVEPHWHDCFEILYMISGTAAQTVNGNRLIVNKGDVVIIKQGDVHAISCAKNEDCKILVVKFLPAVFNSLNGCLNEFIYISSFLNMEKSPVYTLSMENPYHQKLLKVMGSMNEEFKTGGIGYELMIRGYFYEMLAVLIRSGMINIVATEDTGASERLNMQLITDYVSEHINEQMSLSQISELLHLNYSYCSRYFKRLTGNNFTNYIQFVRVCEAERLIVNKGVSISEAAYSCGFPDASTFGKVYKKIRGYAPGNLKK